MLYLTSSVKSSTDGGTADNPARDGVSDNSTRKRGRIKCKGWVVRSADDRLGESKMLGGFEKMHHRDALYWVSRGRYNEWDAQTLVQSFSPWHPSATWRSSQGHVRSTARVDN